MTGWLTPPPPVKVGRQSTRVLAAEWRGVLNQKWNYEIPLVFAHVFLTSTLGACKAREIWANINRRLDLWERGIHTGLMGDALEEGRDRKGCVERCD